MRNKLGEMSFSSSWAGSTGGGGDKAGASSSESAIDGGIGISTSIASYSSVEDSSVSDVGAST